MILSDLQYLLFLSEEKEEEIYPTSSVYLFLYYTLINAKIYLRQNIKILGKFYGKKSFYTEIKLLMSNKK